MIARKSPSAAALTGLRGTTSTMRSTALFAAERAGSPKEGVALAKQAIDSGAAALRGQLRRSRVEPDPRAGREVMSHVHESPWVMLAPLVVLAAVSAVLRPAAGSGNASGAVVNFVVALLIFLLSRLRLWRVRNRLLVSYFLFGVVPLLLVVGLATVTLTTLFGLIAADHVRRELDDRSGQAKTVARQVAAVSSMQRDLDGAMLSRLVTALDPRARAIVKVDERVRSIPDDAGPFHAVPSWSSPDFGGLIEAGGRYFIGAHARSDRPAVDVFVYTPFEAAELGSLKSVVAAALVPLTADADINVTLQPNGSSVSVEQGGVRTPVTYSAATGLPPKRQTLLFSATMPGEVLKLTEEFLREPKLVQVGRRGGPAQTISHAVQTVPHANDKTQWLAHWLREEATGPVLVFCRTKIGADRLATRLTTLGVRAAALHADRTQQQRMSAVEGFRTGTYPVLVATDVAARGLDIEGIAHVVNFEVPDTPEAYVHRVGRTGRAESTGSALTLVAPEEVRALRALEKAVGVQLQ